mmetsp:Transcript_16805/g.54768  ORF Transcript_16805/g.54768 Transcript_16805/m.54768 type:complete len:203 (+) Transcript_16805:1048-1656(+)
MSSRSPSFGATRRFSLRRFFGGRGSASSAAAAPFAARLLLASRRLAPASTLASDLTRAAAARAFLPVSLRSVSAPFSRASPATTYAQNRFLPRPSTVPSGLRWSCSWSLTAGWSSVEKDPRRCTTRTPRSSPSCTFLYRSVPASAPPSVKAQVPVSSSALSLARMTQIRSSSSKTSSAAVPMLLVLRRGDRRPGRSSVEHEV